MLRIIKEAICEKEFRLKYFFFKINPKATLRNRKEIGEIKKWERHKNKSNEKENEEWRQTLK